MLSDAGAYGAMGMNSKLWEFICRTCQAPMTAQVPDRAFSLTVCLQCGSRYLTMLFQKTIRLTHVDLSVLNFATLGYTLDEALYLANASTDMGYQLGARDSYWHRA